MKKIFKAIDSALYPAADSPRLPPEIECSLPDAGCRVLQRSLRLLLEGLHCTAFGISLVFSSIPARLRWESFTRMLMRANAQLVLTLRNGQRKSEIKDIAGEWKRMFPLDGSMQEIHKMDDNTAYISTHVWCPLRGTGDVQACHLLMEFDRALLEAIGGQLVVLRSQAELGVKVCEIAIRRQGLPLDDLIPV